MSAKNKTSEVFINFKKVQGEFLCKVEGNGNVCGAKLAAKTFHLKNHLKRHHVDISNMSLETD